jgi:hypothetical protein
MAVSSKHKKALSINKHNPTYLFSTMPSNPQLIKQSLKWQHRQQIQNSINGFTTFFFDLTPDTNEHHNKGD